jgi:DNA-binding NtrC family response regulator
LRKHAIGPTASIALDQKTMQSLMAYSWPGNVRELENVIERAVTLNQGGVVTMEDLPARIRLQPSHDTPPLSADDLAELFSGLPNLDEIERRYIFVLDATGNNRKRTAEILGINRKTLYRMAARYEIVRPHTRVRNCIPAVKSNRPFNIEWCLNLKTSLRFSAYLYALCV